MCSQDIWINLAVSEYIYSNTSASDPGFMVSSKPPRAAKAALACLARIINSSLLQCCDDISDRVCNKCGKCDRALEIT